MDVEILQVAGAETPEARKARQEKEKKDQLAKAPPADIENEDGPAPVVVSSDTKPPGALAKGRTYDPELVKKSIFSGLAGRDGSDVSAGPRKWQTSLCSWPPMTVRTSPESISSSMAE